MGKKGQAAMQQMGGVGNKGGVSTSPSTKEKAVGYMKRWLGK